jgi:hypothetical protein
LVFPHSPVSRYHLRPVALKDNPACRLMRKASSGGRDMELFSQSQNASRVFEGPGTPLPARQMRKGGHRSSRPWPISQWRQGDPSALFLLEWLKKMRAMGCHPLRKDRPRSMLPRPRGLSGIYCEARHKAR